MSAYSDLEITFRKRDEHSYALHFRFNLVRDDGEKVSDPDPIITADFSALSDADDDPEYGKKLSAMVFTDKVLSWLNPYRAAALAQEPALSQNSTQPQDAKLRIRLSIDASAPELHAVHWETMLDPSRTDQDVPLFTADRLLVSRFLSSGASDWRPIRLRPEADLRALVVVANPPERFKLTPIDIEAELKNARLAMEGIAMDQLASGDAVPPNLNNLSARLRDGYDILYLVCHGELLDGEPQLYLDGAEDGLRTAGQALVQAVDNLDYRPRLIVLASCQSAAKGNSGLTALGPRLAGVGVPAVIAMQGNVYMKTASAFMKTFFTELRKDGQIDRAMTVARGDVYQDREETAIDYWRPVLFMRLRSGRIWYEPGFDDSKSEFEQWGSLCRYAQEGRIVPILGPDVAEHILGSTHALASALAASNNFPMESHESFDLAKVAQFVLAKESRGDFQSKLIAQITAELLRTGKRLLQRPVDNDPDVMEAIVEALSKDVNGTAQDPLKILAGLNAKVFINASGDSLLERFLRRAPVNGKFKQPVPLTVEWRDEAAAPQAGHGFLADPTIATPYVYYMFGKTGSPSNSVLTEDDYFDYLIQTSTYKLMPLVIGDALLSNRLLFLGFPVDDLKFRVMFRLILAKGGRALFSECSHVGVQVDPSETTLASAQRAKKYLERYFLGSKIDIYWGTSADFLRELKVQLDKAKPVLKVDL